MAEISIKESSLRMDLVKLVVESVLKQNLFEKITSNEELENKIQLYLDSHLKFRTKVLPSNNHYGCTAGVISFLDEKSDERQIMFNVENSCL